MKNEFNTQGTKVEAEGVLVPSVKGKDGTGYDIFSQVLNETNTILVQGQVEAGMAAVIIAQLKYLEAKDPDKEIKMLINSPGGSIIDGLAIYDVMRQVKNPIKTIGIGMQASMGSVLFVGGDTRILEPNAQVLVHQGSGGGGEGTPSDLEIGREFHRTIVDRLEAIYQDHTGLTKEYWEAVLNRDTWFTAEQALAIGFAHVVDAPNPEKKAPYADDRATSPVDGLAKSKEAAVAKYDTVEKILVALNTDGLKPEDRTGSLRPELAAKLAQFPQYWTEGKKKEMAAKSDSKVVSFPKKAAAPSA